MDSVPETEKVQENVSLLTRSSSSQKGYGGADGGVGGGSGSPSRHSRSGSMSIEDQLKHSGSGSIKSPSYERIKTKSYTDFEGETRTPSLARRICCLTSFLGIFVVITIILLVIVIFFATGRLRPTTDSQTGPAVIIQTKGLPPKLATVSDYEEYAKLNLDPNAWLYFSSGATQEVTLRDNLAAYSRIRIHPNRQQDVSHVETSLSVNTFGGSVTLPIGLAPTACHWWATKDGEYSTVRAAKAIKTVMIVSIDSSTITDELAKAEPDAILWQQMYIFGDLKDTLYMVDMAERTNCKAIVLTIDKPAATLRYPEMRGQLVYPPDYPFGINYPPNMAPNSGYAKKRDWNDVSWLVNQTKLPVIVKGILTAKEAKIAVQKGASGIIVSNHGGRALDGVPATIDQLSEVVAAVDGQVPVYLDGGIRSGMDVFKALALGAKMVFVGRPTLWGLAHSGQAGVETIFDILRAELVNTMQLAGTDNLTLLNADFVYNQGQRFCPNILI